MGIPVKNLDQAEAWTAGILSGNPDGSPARHVVRIDEADDTGTSSGGHPQIELNMSNDAGSIRDWIVVIESTYGKVVQLLQAAGIVPPTGDDVLEAKVLEGKRIQITVQEQPDLKGEMRSRVIAYSPPGTDVPANMAGLPAGASSGRGAKRDSDLPF